ncbi:MAG: hypothetical protein ACC657_13015 [Thiohalomonadales bacterium]
MNLTYKRKVSEHCDYWEECKFTSLKKGDIFYAMEGNQEGPFLSALSDVELRPSSTDHSKIIWHIETETLSDENFI